MTLPTIDLAQTGANIVSLRKAAGLTVHDLQMVLDSTPRRPFTSGKMAQPFPRWTI